MRKAKRVLIYRLGSLGDTVVALPLFHLVERAFPGSERRLLSNVPVHAKAPAAASVLGASGLIHGYFEYKAGTRNLLELLRLWFRIRRWRPEVLVYAAAARGIKAAERDRRFFRLCGIREQIAIPVTDPMQQNLYGASGPPSCMDQEPEAARLTRNAAALGRADLDDPAYWDLRLTADEHARAQQAVATSSQPAIALCIGTKVQAKDWGIDNWSALTSLLAERYPTHSLWLVGAAEERSASGRIAQLWPGGSVVNLCGALTPRETAAVLARAQIFVGHDSGPMHLAASVQTPCVAVFAARNVPRVWFPYGGRHRVLYHEVSCMGCGLETCTVERKRCLLSITPDEVFTAITQVLQ